MTDQPTADAEQPPTLDEWRALYAATAALKAQAPWEWMEEDEMFGVQDPESGEIGFGSVMGMAGEHFALSLYLGAEGLSGFWSVVESSQVDPDFDPQAILEIPQLQVSFESREEQTKEDRAIIKQLGLKFRGAFAWPLFRSYRPGYAPWYLTGAEARFLTAAIEQTVILAARVKADRESLDPEDGESYLVRVPDPDAEGGWRDEWMVIEEPDVEFELFLEPQTFELLASLPLRPLEVQVDFWMMPGLIQESPGERPFIPYNLLMVEGENGLILGSDVIRAEPTLEGMWGRIPYHVAARFAELGFRPAQLIVPGPFLGTLLSPLSELAGIEVVEGDVDALDLARTALVQYMGQGL